VPSGGSSNPFNVQVATTEPKPERGSAVRVLKQLRRIVDEWIRLADAEGVALPLPEGSGSYSGRFLLRVPPPVHQALALKAKAAGKSLNSYCAERLAAL
jgi:predicted HicB family RNase H-like nuclease